MHCLKFRFLTTILPQCFRYSKTTCGGFKISHMFSVYCLKSIVQSNNTVAMSRFSLCLVNHEKNFVCLLELVFSCAEENKGAYSCLTKVIWDDINF